MKKTRYIIIFILLVAVLLCGCAAGGQVRPAKMEREWPTGPGTIPPSWYDYDPAYGHWFDPWYVNPFTSR